MIIKPAQPAQRRATLLETGLLGLFERLRASRERAHMRSVIKTMLTHSDEVLDDVGLSRAVLQHALREPDIYRSFEDIRRASARDLAER